MKNTIQIQPIFIALILTTFFLACSSSKNEETDRLPDETEIERERPKAQIVAERYRHEFEMTRDPQTNTIPIERMILAREMAAKVLIRQEISRDENSIIKWTERGPDNVGGRTRAILIDAKDPTGNTVFAAGVSGGLWKSAQFFSADPNWEKIYDFFDNLAICSIAQDTTPGHRDTIYFGTGEGWFNVDAMRGLGIWRLTNGGQDFELLESTHNTKFQYVNKIVIKNVDGKSYIFAATRSTVNADGGIFRSIDGGNSWVRVLSTPNRSRGADIELAANGDIYASMGYQDNRDGIYRSLNADNGDLGSWSQVYQSKSGERRIELATAPSNADIVYALIEKKGDIPRIIKATNATAGANEDEIGWVNLPNPVFSHCGEYDPDWTGGQAFYDLIAAVDPNNADHVFIGAIDLFKSIDGGNSWTQISSWCRSCCGQQYVHADQHAMVYLSGSSDTLLFGNDGGIWATTNAGVIPSGTSPTIIDKNKGYNITQYYSCALNPTILDQFIGGAQDNGSSLFSKPGINSTPEITGGDGAFCHIDNDEPHIQITSYIYNRYYITTDAWKTKPSSVTNGANKGRFINPTDYDSKAKILYGAYDTSHYSVIKDVGTMNVKSNTKINEFSGKKVSAVKVSPNEDNVVFFGTSKDNKSEFFKVEDANGNSPIVYNYTTNLPEINGYLSSIDVANNEDTILITFSNYGVKSVYWTTDGGFEWVSVEGDLPDMPIRWGMFAPGKNNAALVATELGVWYTENLNADPVEWVCSNNGLANVRVDMLQSRSADNLVLAATHGRGMFTTDHFSSCPSCLILTGDVESGAYVAADSIIVAGPIGLDANVSLIAGEDILFSSGFESPAGTVLEAIIEDICSPGSADLTNPVGICAKSNLTPGLPNHDYIGTVTTVNVASFGGPFPTPKTGQPTIDLNINIKADNNNALETWDISIEGVVLGAGDNTTGYGDLDCVERTKTITLSLDDFNNAIAGDTIKVHFTAKGPFINPAICSENYFEVCLDYLPKCRIMNTSPPDPSPLTGIATLKMAAAVPTPVEEPVGGTPSDHLKIYPNPIQNNKATLEFEIPENKPVSIFVTNIKGEWIMELITGQDYPKGKHSLELNTASLENGVYFVVFQYGGQMTSKKFMVLD